jgi:hypothetical protein
MAFRKIEAGLVHADVDEFIGKTGTIFYDNNLGDFRISDGVTPGGVALSFGGGGGGGNYTLPTATTTVKGGVKIDGTTIAIANQVISVGTVPYSSLSGTPTIPTNTNQLTNGAGYITSGALSGYATESYVTGRGYITSSALTGLATETYVTTRGYITSSALTGYATQNYVTTQGYITSAALSGYALTSAIPTDISQLRDSQGLLGQGGGGGGTVIRNVENPYSFSIAGDDSTLREISNGESIKITGASGITVTTDAEGNVTITGPNLTSYATQSYVTTQGYITSSALTGYALTSAIPTNNNQLTNGSGYITSSALTGLATESYVTSRGYITGLSWNQLTDKPNLAGTYSFNVAADDSTLREISADETVKFIGAGGVTTASDAEGNITITGPNLTSYATQSYVTSQGYITSSALTGYALTSAIPTNNNQLTNGSGYITSAALVGLSTETYVNQAISNLVDGAPAILDTLKELATSLNNDGNAVASLVAEISKKANTADLVLTIAGDDSTERTISLGEGIRLQGTGSVTITTDIEGKVTINGAAPDLSAYALTSAIPTNNNQLTNGAGYITSSALVGLATETFVTSRGYITGLSWDQLTNKPNLAGTYSWSIAADDSTQVEISSGNLVKIRGAGGITTASDADGNITITGATPDRLTSNSRSAVLNSNGTFSLPTLTAAPANPQAGQMALANGTSWDPIAQGNGAPYMVIYTGTAWIGMGGVTVDQVYSMILELG